jgi:hypothetical protein
MLISQFSRANIKVMVTASSGVAALMLDHGGTAHSKLKIPLNVNSQTMAKWDPATILGSGSSDMGRNYYDSQECY